MAAIRVSSRPRRAAFVPASAASRQKLQWGYVFRGTTHGYDWVVLQHNVLLLDCPAPRADTLQFSWDDFTAMHGGLFVDLTSAAMSTE